MAKFAFKPIPKELSKLEPQYFDPEMWFSELDEEPDWVWDYTVDLEFNRAVSIRPFYLGQALGLDPGDVVRLCAEWTSSISPTLRDSSLFHQFTLDSKEPKEFNLRLKVPGKRSGATLTLTTFLVVASKNVAPVGTVLWEDTHKVSLEDHATRVPVAVVKFGDFPARFPTKHAAWSVDFAPDAYNLPLSTAMQVYLNASKGRFVEELTVNVNETAQAWFEYEITRHLLHRIALDDLFEPELEDYPPGTLGNSLHVKLMAVFGNRTLPEIRQMALKSPQEFDAVIQARSFGEF